MPQNLNDSVIIMKNSIPKISEPCIMAEKIQTVYECGEVLTINDLTVRFLAIPEVSRKLLTILQIKKP